MSKTRLEAFSDAVIAIIITIMVLELKVPEDSTEWGALKDHHTWKVFLAYLLSFIFLGIYWNNHHHMLHAAERTNGAVLWANLHLLFWLSLVPAATAWIDDGVHTAPTAVYGIVFIGSAIAYTILQVTLVRCNGRNSRLAMAVQSGVKEKMSLVLYAAAIALAFVLPIVSVAIYALVALIWLVPDRRIERVMHSQ